MTDYNYNIDAKEQEKMETQFFQDLLHPAFIAKHTGNRKSFGCNLDDFTIAIKNRKLINLLREAGASSPAEERISLETIIKGIIVNKKIAEEYSELVDTSFSLAFKRFDYAKLKRTINTLVASNKIPDDEREINKNLETQLLDEFENIPSLDSQAGKKFNVKYDDESEDRDWCKGIRKKLLQICLNSTFSKDNEGRNFFRLTRDKTYVYEADGKEFIGIFLGIKSQLEEGFESNFPNHNSYQDGGIFVDLFSTPTIEKGEYLGLQGMFPVVNSRRQLYLLKNAGIELSLLHHMSNQLDADITFPLNDLIEVLQKIKDKQLALEERQISKHLESLLKIRRRTDKIIENNRTLLNHYRSNKSKESETETLKKLKDELEGQSKSDQNCKQVFLNRIGDDSSVLWTKQINLKQAELKFFVEQFRLNALRQWDNNSVNLKDRKMIMVIDSTPNHQSVDFEFISKNTFPVAEKMLELGNQPINNRNEAGANREGTGLGLYFFSRALQFMGAIKPNHSHSRFFEVMSENDNHDFHLKFSFKVDQ